MPAWLCIFFPTLWTSFSRIEIALFFMYKGLREQDQKVQLNTEVISSFLAVAEQKDPPSLLCSVLSTLRHMQCSRLAFSTEMWACWGWGLFGSDVPHVWDYPRCLSSRDLACSCALQMCMCICFSESVHIEEATADKWFKKDTIERWGSEWTQVSKCLLPSFLK